MSQHNCCSKIPDIPASMRTDNDCKGSGEDDFEGAGQSRFTIRACLSERKAGANVKLIKADRGQHD